MFSVVHFISFRSIGTNDFNKQGATRLKFIPVMSQTTAPRMKELDFNKNDIEEGSMAVTPEMKSVSAKLKNKMSYH